jgi:hypothetical protein
MAVDLNKWESIFLKIAGISTATLGLIGAFNFYKNNIWKPHVQVLSVNYAKGEAEVVVNGKKAKLKGDSVYLISNDWGIKLGYTFTGNNSRIYDRIEILKRNMVTKIVREPNGME